MTQPSVDQEGIRGTHTVESHNHYSNIANGYEEAFFYSSEEYQEWIAARLLEVFQFDMWEGNNQQLKLVDIGAGTGNFTQILANRAKLKSKILCVEPIKEMALQTLQHPYLEPLLVDAVAFSKLDCCMNSYTHVLMKEIIHHVPEEEFGCMFKGLFDQCRPGGSVVIITRPQEVDYPLFDAAREVWRQDQYAASEITAPMEEAGFEVAVREFDYHASLATDTWCRMVKNRFWSTFSRFSDAELTAGIQEIREANNHKDTVKFCDRLLFIEGKKAESGKKADNGVHESSKKLTLETDKFRKDGFIGPIPVLTPEEATTCYKQFCEYEASLGGKVTGDFRYKGHLLLPWLWDLVHHPCIVEAVGDALGCLSLLCWATDIYIKEPGDCQYTSWHQDSTYVALTSPDVLTAWVALTQSTMENGTLQFLPGSHHMQLPHEDTYAKDNLLLKGQAITELEEQGVKGTAVELQPGEMSLHHIRTAHQSGPNTNSSRRVGIAIRYMGGHVVQNLSARDSVAVVRGFDVFESYEHETKPQEGEPYESRLARHRKAVTTVYPPGYHANGL